MALLGKILLISRENLPSFAIRFFTIWEFASLQYRTCGLPVLAVLGQVLEEGGEVFGTYLVFFQEQPGNVDMSILDSIHKGSDSTFVSAVRFVLAPGREDKSQDRVVGGPKILSALVALCWRGRTLSADRIGNGIYKACP